MFILLVCVTLAGALLRLYQIGSKGLWLDEAFSIWLARQPWTDMMAWIVKIDQHPPLYYTLLNVWIRLGDSEQVVRALSAWAGILTIPIIFWLGKRIAGARVGLLAAVILALSPFHIRFAQEARMYALLTFNASSAVLACVHLLGDPNAANQPIGIQVWCRGWKKGLDGIKTDLAWFAYIVFTAATLLTHNTAVLFVLATNVFVLGRTLFPCLSLRQGGHLARSNPFASGAPGLRPWLRNWLLAQIGVFLLWSPWLRPFIVQARGVYDAFWLPAPTMARIGAALRDFASAHMPDDIGWGHAVWGVYLVLLILGIYGLRRRRVQLSLLLALCLVPFLGELLVSLKRPIFYARTLIWITIPLYLLLAVGLGQLRRWPAIAAGLAILVVVNGISLYHYFVYFEKEQWDEAALYVGERVQPGDLLLFNATWVQIPFDYYFDRLDKQVEERGIPVDLFSRGVLEPKMAASDLPRLRKLARDRSRVWLIYSHDWYTDPQGLIPRALDQGGLRLVERHAFYGLQVFEYVP